MECKKKKDDDDVCEGGKARQEQARRTSLALSLGGIIVPVPVSVCCASRVGVSLCIISGGRSGDVLKCEKGKFSLAGYLGALLPLTHAYVNLFYQQHMDTYTQKQDKSKQVTRHYFASDEISWSSLLCFFFFSSSS